MHGFVSRCLAVLALAAACFAAGPAAAQSEKRIALVIGNGAYQAGALATTANDAGLIAQTLQAAGFDVVGARDLDGDTLRHALHDFVQKAAASGPDTVAMVAARPFANAVVDDAQLQPAAVSGSGHDHVTWRGARSDAMSDRVLHERLQHEIRHECISRVGIDPEVHRQPILKSDLLDLNVVREQLELFGERDLLLACAAERHPQQLTQSRYHALGRVPIGGDERVDRI